VNTNLFILNFELTKPDATVAFNALKDCERPNLKWNHIRAFAEHKTSSEVIGRISSTDEITYNLLNRAQQLFYHQPTRTHLHCFAIGGDYLRCFLITRSGVVASNAFSIHDHPERALRVFYSFFYGDLSWYGLKTDYYVENVKGDRVPYDCSSREMEQIDPYYDVPKGPTLVVNIKEPVCRRMDIVSRGTFVFPARDLDNPEWFWGKCIKEAWRLSQRIAEGDLLSKVPENPYIAKYIHHEDVTRASKIRCGLRLQEGRQVSVKCPLVLGTSGSRKASVASASGTKRTSSQARMDSDGKPTKRIKSKAEASPMEVLIEADELTVREETNVSI
jgi:hypothetical protein